MSATSVPLYTMPELWQKERAGGEKRRNPSVKILFWRENGTLSTDEQSQLVLVAQLPLGEFPISSCHFPPSGLHMAFPKV